MLKRSMDAYNGRKNMTEPLTDEKIAKIKKYAPNFSHITGEHNWNSLISTIDKRTKERDELQKGKVTLIDENKILKLEAVALKEECQLRWNEGEEAMSECDRLKLDIKCLEESTVDKKAFEQVQKERDELKRKVANLEKVIKNQQNNLKIHMDSANTALSCEKDEVIRLKEENKKLKAKVDELEDEGIDMAMKGDDLIISKSRLEKERDELKAKVAKLERELGK